MKLASTLAVALGALRAAATLEQADLEADVGLALRGLSSDRIHQLRRALDERSLVSTIWDDIKGAATCTACEVRRRRAIPR